jgi:dTDP-4-dehydrorhamnose 3,5-epimerase
VIIDLRPGSPTFKQWAGIELSSLNHKAIYVPEGFAHGFLTLVDECEMFYQMSETFHSECAAGVRWNDPVFAIDWPGEIGVMSDRDKNYPDYLP